MRRAWFMLGMVFLATRLAAQEFKPPRVGGTPSGTRIGLFGFGVRGGVDLRSSQIVVGTTLDLGDLFTARLRLRPSGEIGVFNGGNDTFAASFEALYRFTDDDQVAIPYLGTGLSVAGHDKCGSDPNCPAVWVNLVFGFELHYKSTFNWLLEYHGMDAMRKHRLYVGLTTRRGN